MEKSGLSQRLQGHYQLAIELSGVMIQRDGRFVLAVLDNENAIIKSDFNSNEFLNLAIEDLGRVDLKGQLIDPKCYMGAMKPGGGKVHKSCAV